VARLAAIQPTETASETTADFAGIVSLGAPETIAWNTCTPASAE